MIDPNPNNSYKTKKKFTGSYTEVNPIFHILTGELRYWWFHWYQVYLVYEQNIFGSFLKVFGNNLIFR